MKALISYKDWLLLNRGEIRPEIGDTYLDLTFGIMETVGKHDIVYLNKRLNSNEPIPIRCDFYVEIDYNPNLLCNQGFKSMTREEFKELMFNVRTAARLIEHDNLKGDEWLDKLFDTLKQVYYLNELNRTNNVGTESGN